VVAATDLALPATGTGSDYWNPRIAVRDKIAPPLFTFLMPGILAIMNTRTTLRA
jgi:hypothetical protein